MAQRNPRQQTPPDPVPVSPANEAVIDGSKVTFRWEPVEGALEYRLQVASDSTFDNVVLEESTTGENTLSVANRFPTDDETLFWRVMARTEAGWSAGDRVESFISGTAEEADLHLERPDDDEHYGPFPELIRSGAIEVAGEVTGKEKYLAQEAEMGVEHEGVETGQIMGIAAVVILALILGIITVILLVDNFSQTTRRQIAGISGFPELTRIHEQAEANLSEYGIIDEEAGVFRIPIDRAMELVVSEYGARAGAEYSPELTLPLSSEATRADTLGPVRSRPATGAQPGGME